MLSDDFLGLLQDYQSTSILYLFQPYFKCAALYLTGKAINQWIRSRDETVLLKDESTFCHYIGVGTFALFAKPVRLSNAYLTLKTIHCILM